MIGATVTKHPVSRVTLLRVVSVLRSQECFRRNVHGRSYVDIQRSKSILEAAPPAVATLDVSALTDGDEAAAAPLPSAKRKNSATAAPAATSTKPDSAQPVPGVTLSKRRKCDAVEDVDMLALINKGFMCMDKGEDGKKNAAALAPVTGSKVSASVGKSRWEDTDDDDDDAPQPVAPNSSSKLSAAGAPF